MCTRFARKEDDVLFLSNTAARASHSVSIFNKTHYSERNRQLFTRYLTIFHLKKKIKIGKLLKIKMIVN